MLKGLHQFCRLRSQQSSEIFKVIIEANRNSFPPLINKYITMGQFQQETRQIIQTCFNSEKYYQEVLNKPIQYNYGIRIDGKLVAVMLSLDLVGQYKYVKPLLADPSHFAHQFAAEMSHLGIQDMQAGTATYFTRLSVLPQYMGNGIGKQIVYEASKYQSSWGYPYAIAGAKTKPSFGMFTKLGGEILRNAQAVRPTFSYPIILIKNDFRKLIEIVEQSQKTTNK